MKRIVPVLLCAAVCAFGAHHKKAAATTHSSGISDQAFVDLVAQTDMAEANLGQLAQQNAGSQAVKDYASMLVKDHTDDYSKIGALASKAGFTVPKALDNAHIRQGAPLQKLKGAAFDRQYLRMMVSGHEAATAAYDREARDGKNADLKAYAQATIPTLEKHKDNAKSLESKK